MSVKIPTLLAITGAIDPSHAVFYSSFDGENKAPLNKSSFTVLGTLGSYEAGKKSTPETTPFGNPQRIDGCYLPQDHAYLHVKGNIKFSNMINSVSSNGPEVAAAIKAFYSEYTATDGVREYARRVITQLENGYTLFRNKYGFDIKLILDINGNKEVFSINTKMTFGDTSSNQAGFDLAVDKITKSLSGDIDDLFILSYEYIVNMGEGQEVYPSEEFMDGGEGKMLFSTLFNGEDVTGMHSQKIGNAIRTIDTWYSDDDVYPIPVDPYGPDKKSMCLRRSGVSSKSNSIYSVLMRMVNEGISLTSNDAHYLAASIIRGGVLGGK